MEPVRSRLGRWVAALAGVLCAVLVFVPLAAAQEPSPTPTETPTPEPSPTPTETPTPTPTTTEPEPSPRPSRTPRPRVTPSPSVTESPLPGPTDGSSPTPAPTSTGTVGGETGGTTPSGTDPTNPLVLSPSVESFLGEGTFGETPTTTAGGALVLGSQTSRPRLSPSAPGVLVPSPTSSLFTDPLEEPPLAEPGAVAANGPVPGFVNPPTPLYSSPVPLQAGNPAVVVLRLAALATVAAWFLGPRLRRK